MSQPWMKFFGKDWCGDRALRSCSLGARGLWLEILLVMGEAEPRGSLLVNGRQVDIKKLSGMVGADKKEVEQLFSELDEAGVFSRDADGTVFSRKMRRDEIKAQQDKANGKGGGNPTLIGGNKPPDKPPNDHPDKPNLGAGVNPPDKAQKPDNPEAKGQKESAAQPLSLVRIETPRPETLHTKCLKLVGEEPVSAAQDFVILEDCVDKDGITEADVITGIRDAMAKPGFRIKYWESLVGWARKAAQNRLENKPKFNSHAAAPPDNLDPSESTRPVDMGSGVVLEEKTLVKMIRSTFDLEMPNRMAFYNFMLKHFDRVETFRRGISIKAPHLMKFFPPAGAAPDPAEPALAVGR